MTFTAEQVLLIIAAIGVVAVNIITAWKANTKSDITDRKVDAGLRQNDMLIAKAVEIHELANGNLSKMTASFNEALSEIKHLKDIVAALQAEKDKLTLQNGHTH